MTTKTTGKPRGRYTDRQTVQDAVAYYNGLKKKPYGTKKQVAAMFHLSSSTLCEAIKRSQ